VNSRIHFEEAKINDLEARCRTQGVPLTLQRRVIMEDLAGRYDHPTADQVYEAVITRYPGISRSTVYRVLETFVQLGAAQKISNPEAKARFDADTSRHHHLVCHSCDQVADFSSDDLDRITLPPEIGNGFMVADYSLTVTGTCAGCRTIDASSSYHGRTGTRHLTKRRRA
jgi:Fur family peroxide stress response transcriptional regulator